MGLGETKDCTWCHKKKWNQMPAKKYYKLLLQFQWGLNGILKFYKNVGFQLSRVTKPFTKFLEYIVKGHQVS